ncbi:MAG: tRNA uridine-5-carboxymethylaminomethyl(34) synthesis GTPase MnmE [Candidatus Fibromonas sp.]|jgi:tRNA modification GTPase|nr:tRNA uridine-5-carboxymethylaminomethyl(34) synthesis GTPase MnmE [Candidatus Fibromonas sp.]
MESIVALATPPGKSAIAVVRVSGKAVREVCKAVLPDFKMEPRIAKLVRCRGVACNAPTMDNLIAIFFPAPNSYTGEDVLELFPHGNPFIVRRLIEEICKVEGVRLAKRGEFTERAFLNGKMDLTQAEAVGDMLSASNSKSLSNAQRLLSGEVSGEIKRLAERVKEAAATLELEVDFAEDVGGIENGELRIENCLNEILQGLSALKKRFRKAGNELPKAVLFGTPNAGKSSLINALVKEDRLLVNEAPGTTRDFVEVPLHLPSGDILLIDTAGLADTAQNEIDEQAMQKSREILEKANLKILVTDISTPLPPEFEKWQGIANITVCTHTDIKKNSQLSTLNSQLKFLVASPKNEGIKELREALDNIFFPKEEMEEAWITSERQIACIKKAEECVLRASQAGAVELMAFEIRDARNALCSIIGEISDESVLNAIFSSYCVGK